MQEIRPEGIVRFDQFTHEILTKGVEVPEGKTQPKITPVGIVRYANGSRIAAFGAEDWGRLKVKYLEINPADELPTNPRVVNFPEYDEVMVGQVNLNSVEYMAYPSILTQPRADIRFDYVDTYTGEEVRDHLVPEREFLQVFTGVRSGILAFSGGGPEELALVLDRVSAGKRFAEMFFFSTDGEKVGAKLDSLTAFFTWVGNLKKMYLEEVPDHMQTKVLEILEKGIETGAFRPISSQRQILAEMMIIAAAQLNRKGVYSDLLEEILKTDKRTTRWERFQRRIGMRPPVWSLDAYFYPVFNQVIINKRQEEEQRQLVSRTQEDDPDIESNSEESLRKQKLAKERAAKGNKYDYVMEGLVTDEAKAAREMYEPHFGSDARYLFTYVNQLIGLMPETDIRTDRQYADVMILLTELKEAPWNPKFTWYFDKREEKLISNRDAAKRPFKALIEDIISECYSRQTIAGMRKFR